MHLYGKVIVIKRNGTDGAHFPLTATCCLFGRGLESDIRIQLPTVDNTQCQIDVDEKGHVFMKNMSTTSTTLVNDKVLSNSLTALSHGDIITIVDRKFRFEFPADSRFYPHNKSPKIKTPKSARTSLTSQPGSGEKDYKISRRSSAVSPLSPRTDNVPTSAKSPHSAKKNVIGTPVPSTDGDDFGTKSTPVPRSDESPKKNTSSDLLFGLSPSSFYKASSSPRSLKNLSESEQEKINPGLEISSNIVPEESSHAPAKSRTPGSPYLKTSANLRKSITDLRRRSVPVFELEENTTQQKANLQQDVTAMPVQSGRKRKSSSFAMLSAKRKSVSFGPNLSPEHFDKALPPKTPIKRGATPGRIDRQDRKSLLKTKSQKINVASPYGKSPTKAESPLTTPVKGLSTPQAVGFFNATSPNVENPAKLQTPRSRPVDPSLSLRSTPKTISEKSSPSNKKSLQVADLIDKVLLITTATDGSTPLILSPKMKSSGSGFQISTPLRETVNSPKSVLPGSSFFLEKSLPARSNSSVEISTPRRSSSPLHRISTPKSSTSSPHTILTPRRSSSSPHIISTPKSSTSSPHRISTPRRSSSSPHVISTPRRSSSPSHRISTPKSSSSSPHRMSTSRRSSSFTQKIATPRRSSSFQKPSTPRRSSSSPYRVSTPKSSSSSPHRISTPRRYSSSPHRISTPKSSSSSPHRISTPRRSSSSPHRISTPRSSSASPHRMSTSRRSSSLTRKIATPRSSSFQKPSTPRRTSSSPQKSSTPRSNSSPQKPLTPRRSSSSPQKSLTPRSSSFQKISTPIKPSSSPSTYNRSLSPKADYSENLAMPDLFKNASVSSPSTDKREETPSRATAVKTTPKSSVKPMTPSGAVNLSLSSSPTQSQDLFSQFSPETVLGQVVTSKQQISPKAQKSKSIPLDSKSPSPIGMKRIFRTPKQKSVIAAEISPSALKRLMGTPKAKNVHVSVVSPTGIKSLVKTPRIKKAHHIVDSPSGLKLLLKTPKEKQIIETPLTGIREMVKTPSTLPSNNTRISAVSSKLYTPQTSKQMSASANVNNSNAEPLCIMHDKSIDTPRPVFSEKRVRNPKKFFDESTNATVFNEFYSGKSPVNDTIKSPKSTTPQSGKRSVGRSPSAEATTPQTGKRSIGRSPSAEATMPQTGKRSIGRSPSAASTTPQTGMQSVGRLSSSKPNTPQTGKRSVGRPPSAKPNTPQTGKRSVGRPSSSKPNTPQTGKRRPLSSKPNTPQTGKRSVGRPPLSKKIIANLISPAEKILSPPQDFNKVLALRAIHGHGITPKLATFKVGTPKFITKPAASSAKKTPYKKTWSDIVKCGVQKPAPAKQLVMPARGVLKKRMHPSLIKKVQKTPKTPRAFARALAPTTGHADSPVTIIVGKKIISKPKTPKPLPRKGRKESLSKASRKSAGNMSFTGLAEMFSEQAESGLDESALYADIPDTPNGPNGMFISPLSNQKKRIGARKSTNLVGVKELFIQSNTTSTVSPSGLRRIMKTPKRVTNDVSPTGIRRLLATPKTKGLPVSPSGLEILFKTPVGIATTSGRKGKSVKNQAAESQTAESHLMSDKSGIRGRKRKAEESISILSPKKIFSSPAQEITQIRVDEPVISKAMRQKTSQTKSPGKNSPRKKVRRMSSPDVGKTVALSSEVVEVERTEVKIIESVENLLKIKTTDRSRRGKTQNLESIPTDEIASLAAEGHTTASVKTAGRGERKIQIVDSLPTDVTVALASGGKISPKPVKTAGKGRRGKLQIVESAPTDVIAPLGKITPSAVKTAGRGRRGKIQNVESAPADIIDPFIAEKKIAPSPVKPAGRGRRGKLQNVESAPVDVVAPLAIDGKIAPSPVKIAGQGRRGKLQNVESAPTDVLAPLAAERRIAPSPVKTAGRGRRGILQIVDSAPADAKISPSPVKTAGRGRRGKLQVIESAPADVIVPLVAEGKTAGRGRRGKLQNVDSAPADLVAQFAADEAVAPSPKKTAGRGRRGKLQNVESAPVDVLASLATTALTAPSPVKTAARGKRKVLIIESTPLDVTDPVAAGGKSPVKPASQGRRDKLQIVESASADVKAALSTGEQTTKSTGRGRRGKLETVKSTVVEELASVSVRKISLSPAKKSRRGKVQMIESAPFEGSAALVSAKTSVSPVRTGRKGKSQSTESAAVEGSTAHTNNKKISGPGRQGKSQITESALEDIAPISKAVTKSKQYHSVKESFPVKTKDATLVTKVGRRRNVQSPFTSPARKIGTTRGARGFLPNALAESVESVTDVPQDKQSKVKRKAENTAAPVPLKKVKVHSPVQTSPVKPRGRTAHVSAVESSSPVKVSSQSKRGQTKKAVVEVVDSVPIKSASPVKPISRRRPKKTSVPRKSASPVKTISRGRPKKTSVPIKSASPVKTISRGRPKKAVTETLENSVPQVTRKQEKPEVQTVTVSGKNKKTSKPANITSSKAVKTTAQAKATVATRRSKRQ